MDGPACKWHSKPKGESECNTTLRQEGTGGMKCSQQKEKCLLMTYLVQAVAHAFCCTGTTSQFKPIQDDLCLETRTLAIFCCSVLKQAVIVTHICWAIDVVQGIPYGKRQPATSRRTHWETKAKNFTISSDACATDRKMRMTPPRSFSLSPCDAQSRCTSRACTTRGLTVTGSF